MAIGNGSSRGPALCNYVVSAAEPLIIPDTWVDPRFADNPLVRGEPHVRFYAGVPLQAPGGEVIQEFLDPPIELALPRRR